MFKRPTKAFQDTVAAGGDGLRVLSLKGVVASEGGIPLLMDGKIVGAIGVIGGVLVALIFNLLLFFAAFRLLTSEEIDTADLIPGVLVAAVLWQILQYVGGIYVEHVIRHAKETSGLFAFVLGLLAWLYLEAEVTLYAAEVDVVLARHLWPRSIMPGDPAN